MLTEKETAFIQYWEQNKEREGTVMRKLSGGFPVGLLFTIPILLLVMVVYIFMPEWYTKVSNTSPGMFLTAIFAMFIIVLFYAFFRMQWKWESNEQYYRELKAKQQYFDKRIQQLSAVTNKINYN